MIALDRHPLYGLLLQFLVTEALDRELGDETLLITPPPNQTGPENEWKTSILYRPPAKSDVGAAAKTPGYLNLGSLDSVTDQIARHLSLETLPLPYSESRMGYGLWSWAFHLLIDLKVVVGRSDRWTLSSLLHDRLYTGILMAKVLRDRRRTRETIHQFLLRLWQTAASEEKAEKFAREVLA